MLAYFLGFVLTGVLSMQDIDSSALWQNHFGVSLCGGAGVRVSKRGNFHLQHM